MSELVVSNTLSTAVLEALAYADVFHYPLRADEIHRYLPGINAQHADVLACLQTLADKGTIAEEQDFYFLGKRDNLIKRRQQQEQRAADLWPNAIHYAERIGRLPYVRMVAVTGSLAVNNIDENADIDFLIITAPGRLWITRLMIIGIVRMARRQGIHLCPNYLISENAMQLQTRNLFTARELCQMIPLVGKHFYDKMMNQNAWVLDFLPNAFTQDVELPIDSQPGQLKKASEWLFASRMGDWLENWEMQRKIRKLTTTHTHLSETNFTKDQCKGHFDGHQARVMGEFENKRRRLLKSPVDAQTSQSHDKKVLFGQSYFLRFDQKLWQAMKPYPPLGTLYAASYVRNHGYEVALFDAMLAESETEWEQALNRERPHFAIIYEDNFNYLSKMCLARMREAAQTMIRMARNLDCTVIICGSDATDHSDLYLSAGAHYVLIGEGEETLLQLLDALSAKTAQDANHIVGVVSAISPEASRRPVMKKLDDLPMPAWDLLDIDRYRAIWKKRHGYFSMNLATTRGCPYHCNWCSKPIWGQRYNVHSPERVVQEIKHLVSQYQPDHIWFVDDIMGLKPGWIEDFADLLETEDLRIPFKCLSRADLLVKPGVVQAFARAGCESIWVGAESGEQRILDAMEKGTRVEQIRESAAALKQAGIQVGFFLQFGYPGETRADIEKTLELVRDCMPDDIGISVSYPLPGTSFYARVKDQLGRRQNWQDSADLAMLYQGPFSTAFYRQLHKVIHKEFRSRRTALRIKAILSGAQRPKTSDLRAVVAMIYHQLTLPLERFLLNKRADSTAPVNLSLEGAMDYSSAAIPSPQGDD